MEPCRHAFSNAVVELLQESCHTRIRATGPSTWHALQPCPKPPRLQLQAVAGRSHGRFCVSGSHARNQHPTFAGMLSYKSLCLLCTNALCDGYGSRRMRSQILQTYHVPHEYTVVVSSTTDHLAQVWLTTKKSGRLPVAWSRTPAPNT